MKKIFARSRRRRAVSLLLSVCVLLSMLLAGCGEADTSDDTSDATAAYSVTFHDPVSSGEDCEILAAQRTESGLVLLCRVGNNPYSYELITLNDDLAPVGTTVLPEDEINVPVAFALSGDSLLLWWRNEYTNNGFVERDGETLFVLPSYPDDSVLAQDAQGRVFACTGGRLYTQIGEVPMPTQENGGGFCYVSCLFEQEGAVRAILTEQTMDEYSMWGFSGSSLCRLDSEEAIVPGEALPVEAEITAACALDGTCYFVIGDTVCSYAGGVLSTVASLLPMGIQGSSVVWLEARQDGSLLLALEDSLALLTPADGSGVPLLRIATIGTVGVSTMLSDAVILFNRTDADFKADLTVFSSAELMNLAIASGEQFALLCLGDTFLLDSYAEKGALAPLDDMTLLQSEELFQNILDACRTEDGLYYFPPLPALYGIMTPESIEIDSIDSLFACSEENHIYPYMYNEAVFGSLLSDGISQWLDRPDGFLDESFLRLLEYCNSFPSYDAAEQEPMIDEGVRYWKNVQFCSIYSTNSFLWQDDSYSYINEKAAFHPSPFGPWNALAIGGGEFGYLGVCEGGSMERAEAFLEYLLSEQYINNLRINDGIYGGYSSIPLRRLSKVFSGESGERLLALMESADHLGTSNADVREILYAETSAYFEGDIDAETCARRIQERVDIFLSEQG